MIRWGTLIAGLFGFIAVLAAGLGLGKAWGQALISALFAVLAFGLIGHWWMRLWQHSLKAAHLEQVELEAIAEQNAAAAAAEKQAKHTEEFPV